jgi:hypothetical protein
MEFVEHADLKRTYGESLLIYKGCLYSSYAIDKATLQLTRIQLNGEISNEPALILDMEKRPTLTTPPLGFFLNPNKDKLYVMTKSIRRQYKFGLAVGNFTTGIVSFAHTLVGSSCMRLSDAPSLNIGSKAFLSQIFNRSKALLNFKGEPILILTPDFAVYGNYLLHVDGIVGELDTVQHTITNIRDEFKDSLALAQIKALGWSINE